MYLSEYLIRRYRRENIDVKWKYNKRNEFGRYKLRLLFF